MLISLSYDFSSTDKLFQGDLVIETYFSLQDEGYILFENFDGFCDSGINYDSVCYCKFLLLFNMFYQLEVTSLIFIWIDEKYFECLK